MTTQTETAWPRILRWLDGQLDELDIATWLQPVQAVDAGSVLQLYTPNDIVCARIREQFHDVLLNAARQSSQGRLTRIEVLTGDPPASLRDNGSSSADTQRPTAPRYGGGAQVIDGRQTFTNYVQGKSNQVAKAAAEQVASRPGDAYNPLLICGNTGLGKTHLMRSVAYTIRQNHPDAAITLIPAEKFLADLVSALRYNRTDAFKRFYRSQQALLIDDIQFFADKRQTQEEFFYTFNALLDEGRQIVMTCDRYPRELDGLDERLKNRFAGGMSVFIEPPELETRAAILLSKAESDGLELNEDVAFFIAEKIRSNVRELEGALRMLNAQYRLIGGPITVDFARTALRHMLMSHERMVTMESIQRRVAEFYQIRKEDLRSKKRTKTLTLPRHVAMYLCKELTSHSYPEIAAAFDKRDHTTILHGCRKIAQLRKTDSGMDSDLTALERALSP
ncbi:MAG: chromosomal replication initiator protein DnaA [Oceanococcaceae bacterium]